MSVHSAVAAPPTPGVSHYTGERSIAEFVVKGQSHARVSPLISYRIAGEIGRGAYGLVKRGHEVMSDGSWGVRLVNLSADVVC